MKTSPRRVARLQRHQRVRKHIAGTSARPRLAIYRSLQHVYAQVIDDDAGHTVVAASSLDPEIRQQIQEGTKKDEAAAVGKLIGRRALDAGIETVVFDRGGFPYHGRVKALAEAAREAGLKF
ncbi:MAG: 50S ribosomal protein L18 [Caldilineales bacterium]|nr:50S ribosomal protein L18 [Caldilineales bacterium]